MAIAIVMALAAIALYRAWSHGQPDPLEQGMAAYRLGDWEGAERSARRASECGPMTLMPCG